MTTYLPPKKNTQLIFYVSLVDSLNRPQFAVNPTIATGDVKITTDDSALANTATTPTVVSSSQVIKVTLSTGEMNGDNIAVVFHDQTNPPAWDDLVIPIQTSAHQFDDLTVGQIKKNTALTKFPFLMVDSTNHLPATGKTVTVTRSIDGGSFGAGTLSGVTEVANGIYTVDFGSGDLNGNCISVRATATGCDDTFITLVTST